MTVHQLAGSCPPPPPPPAHTHAWWCGRGGGGGGAAQGSNTPTHTTHRDTHARAHPPRGSSGKHSHSAHYPGGEGQANRGRGRGPRRPREQEEELTCGAGAVRRGGGAMQLFVRAGAAARAGCGSVGARPTDGCRLWLGRGAWSSLSTNHLMGGCVAAVCDRDP